MSKNYMLELPDYQRAIENFAAILGKEKALELWKEACLLCGVSEEAVIEEDLDCVYCHLSEREGVIGVYGTSLLLRLRTYQQLSDRKRNRV